MRYLTFILGVSCVSTCWAADPPYQARLTQLAGANTGIVEVKTIGNSRQGHPIQVVWLGDKGDLPTYILVAGIDGRHKVGVETAIGVAEKLAADHKDLLKTVRIAIIPCLNPDNYMWQLDAGHPKTDFGRTFAPHDADHDARVNEDSAEDLNGDGVISLMRIKNPAPGSEFKAEFCIDPDNTKLLKKPDATKGQRADYALLTEGTDNDGDGKFNEDGIGGIGGGTDLNMNFPYRWPEFSDGAGPYPLSEPESLAFAQWMLTQNNVVAVIAYAPGDTFLNTPQAGRFDASGSLTLGIEDGDKAAYDEVSKLFKDTTKMTGAPGMELAGSLTGWVYANEGALSFSTPVWVRPDLVKKDEPKKEEAKPADAEKKEGEAKEADPTNPSPDDIRARIRAFQDASPAEREKMMAEFGNLPPEVQARFRAAAGGPPPAAQPAAPAAGQPATPGAGGGRGGRPPGGPPGGGGGRRGAGGGGRGGPGGGGAGAPAPAEDKKAEPDSDDPKWLKYDADQVKAGATSGFLDWKPFKHPTLGDVEVGGFIPGFKLNPPDSELPRLAEEQTKFIAALAAKAPKITTQPPVVEHVGPGIWRISIRAVNDGAMASMPQVNTKARHGLPTLLSIDLPMDKLISGEKFVRSWVIPGNGGQMEAEWLISADDGSSVNVNFQPSVGAKSTIKIDLKEAAK